MRDLVAISINDSSQVGEARRAATALALASGFDETDVGRVALVATEAASNLYKHSLPPSGGELVVRALLPSDGGGIELLALDRGPGMADVGKCLRDGFSTSGSAGLGLGAISRLADHFDIHSTVGVGTAILARVRPRRAELPAPSLAPSTGPVLDLGAVCLPVDGEDECGDAWTIVHSPQRTVLLLVDGLGHGPLAATASRTAIQAFRKVALQEPDEVLRVLHAALRPTRGAAAALAVIDRDRRKLRFAGVGNIAGMLCGSASRQGLISLSGTLGHEVRKFQAVDHDWPKGATLVMHSDGLATSWDLARYPGLSSRHPALLAGVLYRDHRRVRDDVTVVVLRDPLEDRGS